MALWLGINEDLFDAGVALCDGTQVLFAANEERYSRRKNEGGFPFESLAGLFAYTGVEPADIDRICVSGLMTPPPPVRLFPWIHKWLFEARRSRKDSWLRRFFDDATFYLPVSHTSEDSWMRRLSKPLLGPMTRHTLPSGLKRKPLSFVDHHLAHAAGAWCLSGFEDALCITTDGMGDGLSMTVCRCSPEGGVERLWTASSRDSLGLFFQVLAEAFGFVSCRDEGKITGLAAGGDASRIDVPSPFVFENGQLRYAGQFGQRGIDWAKATLASRYAREDVAAWAQELLERHTIEVAQWWLRETGLRRLVVAGGCVANVKLNQRLHELDEVDVLSVYPNMGDGGLALGAICDQQGMAREQLRDVFFGESYTDADIERALQRASLAYEPCPEPEVRTAELLAEGRIVARFWGRMEWGPRALGNRSILVRTTDRAVVQRLNDSLQRSDFMPFAPALLDEDAEDYLVGVDAARHAAEFMTVCFDCAEQMAREHPAVVHVDGTARAQLVRHDHNPTFHRILSEYKQRAGSSVVLNTSFNVHEEPIVRTPEHAITAFLKARLDYLVIGHFLVRGPQSPSSASDASS